MHHKGRVLCEQRALLMWLQIRVAARDERPTTHHPISACRPGWLRHRLRLCLQLLLLRRRRRGLGGQRLLPLRPPVRHLLLLLLLPRLAPLVLAVRELLDRLGRRRLRHICVVGVLGRHVGVLLLLRLVHGPRRGGAGGAQPGPRAPAGAAAQALLVRGRVAVRVAAAVPLILRKRGQAGAWQMNRRYANLLVGYGV